MRHPGSVHDDIEATKRSSALVTAAAIWAALVTSRSTARVLIDWRSLYDSRRNVFTVASLLCFTFGMSQVLMTASIATQATPQKLQYRA
ncbi:MAG: hypothetical protein WDN69_37560 [Aliidongia sp.]